LQAGLPANARPTFACPQRQKAGLRGGRARQSRGGRASMALQAGNKGLLSSRSQACRGNQKCGRPEGRRSARYISERPDGHRGESFRRRYKLNHGKTKIFSRAKRR